MTLDPRHDPRRDAIVHAWDRAWNHGEIDALDAILDATYMRHTAGAGNGVGEGREEYKQSILVVKAAFPDLETTIDDILVDGDKAAVRWSTSGTHLETFRDSPATGKRVTVAGVTISTFSGSRIVEDWVTFDPVDLLRQLGILHIGR